MYNVRSGTLRWEIIDFSSDGNSTACSISHRLQHICKSNQIPKVIKCHKFDLDNEGQGQGEENETCAIRVERFESI